MSDIENHPADAVDPDHRASERNDRVVDAASLKALAHPLRVEMFDRLAMLGPATASQLADALSESSGATSYHLRQLARHGFIEEDPTQGTARERYWRVVPGGVTMNPADFEVGSAEYEAGALVVRQMTEQRFRHVDDFIRRGQRELGTEWVQASALMSARTSVTADELKSVSEEIATAIDTILERFRDREAVAGARPIVLHFNAFPLVGAPTDTPQE